ncbi:MAG: 16S rRNA (cytidine(1402)-2'-O)-methyltransferase [Candidatus Cloacimonetes bacterium]|nr:16S rRNA (cytidine(1402)-2'-O)-methyltransferase [Candidatus Cloacimonadota bacterium]
MNKGILYLVPTPVGNLEDITLRALSTLKSVTLIAAEDTRHSGKLLKHYEIKTHAVSYHKFNERQRTGQLLEKLQSSEDIALITDAGSPGISDPAGILVAECVSNGIQVCALPGATAFVPALTASGLNCDSFLFAGFPPDKLTKRKELLQRLLHIPETLVFYEAPHRIHKFISELSEIFGERHCVVARELTKLHESFYRGNLDKLVANLKAIPEKGEFVIIVDGATEATITDKEITARLTELFRQGERLKKAVKVVSELLKIPRNRVYTLALKLKKADTD